MSPAAPSGTRCYAFVGLLRGVADTETKIKRTVRTFEFVDESDHDLICNINERRAHNSSSRPNSPLSFEPISYQH
jgi:hypothetical protein